MSAGLMAGKRGLIMGVANDKSIAWGIAQACHGQGAELAFTYQGDALKKRVDPLAASVGSDIVLPCDVTDTGSVDAVFEALEGKWGRLDFLLQEFNREANTLASKSVDARTSQAGVELKVLIEQMREQVQNVE